MKLIQLVALIIFTSESYAQMAKKMVGIWEMAYIQQSDGTVQRMPPGNYKFFGADNSYKFMTISAAGACFSQIGSFKVLSDSLYVEEIKTALNPTLENQNISLPFNLENPDILIIKVDLKNGFPPYKESWKRVTACNPHQ